MDLQTTHTFLLQVKLDRNLILVVLGKKAYDTPIMKKIKSTNSFTKVILQPCKHTVSDRSTFSSRDKVNPLDEILPSLPIFSSNNKYSHYDDE